MDSDYYEILQVSPNADPEVIQAAYRRLAEKWHPDRNPGDRAAPEKMRRLNEAYEILSNQEKRRAYDQRRSDDSTAEPSAATRRAQGARATSSDQSPQEPRPSPGEPSLPFLLLMAPAAVFALFLVVCWVADLVWQRFFGR
jgi:curved DNA-binding protein CbpA